MTTALCLQNTHSPQSDTQAHPAMLQDKGYYPDYVLPLAYMEVQHAQQHVAADLALAACKLHLAMQGKELAQEAMGHAYQLMYDRSIPPEERGEWQ